MSISDSIAKAEVAARLVIGTVMDADSIMFTAAALVLHLCKMTGRTQQQILTHLVGVIAVIEQQPTLATAATKNPVNSIESPEEN